MIGILNIMMRESEFDLLCLAAKHLKNTIGQEELLALLWYEKAFGIEIKLGKECMDCQQFNNNK